jgi:hypothetical protein
VPRSQILLVMATITESVKESLLGTTKPEELSQTSRATFLKYAQRDESGELYMGEEDFVNAIAPPDEDYVSPTFLSPLPIFPTGPPDADPGHTHSTRSSETNTAYSLMWPTDAELGVCLSQTGPHSTTF